MARPAEHNECPIHSLSKSELVFLATHHCKHGHTYLEHWGCYSPEIVDERIGFLDIETSNLAADFGIILSYCIKDSKSNKIFSSVITAEDIQHEEAGAEDRRVVAKLIEDMQQFDRLVTYYGARFDIPYIRTRAIATGVKFPPFGSLVHTDLWFTIRARFRMSSNRLENACRCLLGKTEKTRIESRYWRGGTRGDAESLRYILKHNKKDVLDLERLYNKVQSFFKKQNRSV